MAYYFWITNCKSNHYPIPDFKAKHHSITIMLIISGIETNPGPRSIKYPCGICKKACRWGQKAIACDNCDQWFHSSCMGMSSSRYETLANTSISWTCTTCDVPNHSTILYESIMSVSNSFSVLVNSSDRSSVSHTGDNSVYSSIGSPMATSSPKHYKNLNKVNEKSNKLRIVNINFQSVKNKVADLETLIDSANPDIILGTETWLTADMASSEFIPSEYQVYRRDRPSDPHGGVLIAVRQNLTSSAVHCGKEAEMISIKVDLLNSKSAIISAAYRPPNRVDDDYTFSLINDITEIRNKHKSSYFILGGDFNLPDIKWPSRQITGRSVPTRVTDQYCNMQDDLALDQIVDFPTRDDKTLDLFFVSHSSLVEKCKPLPALGKSDHDIVMLDTLITPTLAKPGQRKIFLWKRADTQAIQESLKNLATELVMYNDINVSWTQFKNHVTDMIQKHVPTKLSRNRHSQPWINSSVKHLSTAVLL